VNNKKRPLETLNFKGAFLYFIRFSHANVFAMYSFLANISFLTVSIGTARTGMGGYTARGVHITNSRMLSPEA